MLDNLLFKSFSKLILLHIQEQKKAAKSGVVLEIEGSICQRYKRAFFLKKTIRGHL